MKRILSSIILAFCFILAFGQNGFTRHTVKWYEDLNSISIKYNVPVEVIVRVNNLSSEHISARQVLLIPQSREFWGEDTNNHRTAPKKSEASGNEDGNTTECGKSVNITIALNMTGGSQAMNTGNMQMYCGALIAAKKLGEEGINVEMTGLDASKGISRSQLNGCNVVIGPIKADELQKVLDMADSTTTVVSPLDHKADRFLQSHDNFVQAAPMGTAQYEGAVKWALEEKPDAVTKNNFLVFYWENDMATLQDALKALDGASCKTIACQPSGDMENLEEYYDAEAYNIAILAITNEAVLGNTLRNLRVFSKECQLQIMCNSKATSYESIPEENMHKGNVHCLCPYFVDYTDPATLEFIHSYRALFNAEPTQYAFQGYDLTYYFGKCHAENGDKLKDILIQSPRTDLMQVSVKFKQNGTDKGLSNHGIRKVLYDSNYRILLLK